MSSLTLLTTKLIPPKVNQILSRDRLLSLIADRQARLVLVHGPAGYGKTTLISEFASSCDARTVWLRLDSDDRDFALFLSYLLEGLSKCFPDFGSEIRERIKSVPDVHADAEVILTLLINELAEVNGGELVFVLDDYHTLGDCEDVQAAIGFLLEHCPPDIRVVIAGRERPNFYLGRLRLQQAIVEIDQSELRFSRDEIASLFNTLFEIPVEDKDIDILSEKTEGWAAALVLVNSSLTQSVGADLSLRGLPNRDCLYEYLAEEIFSCEPCEVQDLLLKTAPLSCVDPLVVREVLSLKKGDGLLREAFNNNALVSSHDGPTFRCHPLYREFLLHRLHERFGSGIIKDLSLQYAKAFEKGGDIRQAIPHFFNADKTQEAARLVETVGREMIEGGQIDTLERWLMNLPDKVRSASPYLSLFEGQILKRRGKLAQALEKFEESRLKFGDDTRGVFVCLYEAGDTHKWMGDYRGAAREFEQADSLGKDDEAKALAQTPLISCYLMMGEREKADDLCHALLHRCQKVPGGRITARSKLAFIQMCTGRFLNALATMEEAVKEGLTDGSCESLLLANNLARCRFLLAHYEEARSWAEQALDISRRYRQRFFEPTALDTLGLILLAQGEETEGLRLLREGLELAEKFGDEETIVICLNHLGTYHRRAGNVGEALRLHSEALKKAEMSGLPYLESVSVSNLGADHIAGDSVAAEELLARACRLASQNRFRYLEAASYYHNASLLAGNTRAEAADYLARALDLASEGRYDHFLIQEGRASLALLVFAFERGMRRDYVSTILERIGSVAVRSLIPLLNSGDASLRDATIRLLGKIGDSIAINPLRKLLRGAEPELKGSIRRALEAIPTQGPHPRKFLTPREVEVLELIGGGATNKGIAHTLFLSEATVKTHINRIFHKLGLADRVEAVLYYQKTASSQETRQPEQ